LELGLLLNLGQTGKRDVLDAVNGQFGEIGRVLLQSPTHDFLHSGFGLKFGSRLLLNFLAGLYVFGLA
jgi:hypothetical protein